MASTLLYTYSDVQSELLDYIGSSSPDKSSLRKVRQAIENAYRDFVNLRLWSYFQTRGALNTVAYYNTGTITYVDATGAVTLSGGTFPSWAAFGWLRINAVDYQVSTRDSDTQLTLSVNTRVGSDVSSASAYTLYRDTYPLQVNCVRIGTLKDANRSLILQYVQPNDFIESRAIYQTPTIPFRYTIASDEKYVGTMAIKFYPPPDQAYQYMYMYQRAPRYLTTPSYTTGTVTTSGTTVTGTGTTWAESMIGCVIRFGSDGTTAVTGTTGSNRYSSQRIITGWTNSGSLLIDSALSTDLSTATTYEISDPIDLEATSMYTAFLRRAEWEVAQMFNREDVQIAYGKYQQAERLAFEADSRSYDRRPNMGKSWQRVPDYATLADSTS